MSESFQTVRVESRDRQWWSPDWWNRPPALQDWSPRKSPKKWDKALSANAASTDRLGTIRDAVRQWSDSEWIERARKHGIHHSLEQQKVKHAGRQQEGHEGNFHDHSYLAITQTTHRQYIGRVPRQSTPERSGHQAQSETWDGRSRKQKPAERTAGNWHAHGSTE